MSIHKLLTKVDESSLERARDFCKIDSNFDDELLKIYILSARKKVMSEVGERIDDFFDENPIFEATVLIDVFTHYNNRDKDSNAMIFAHSPYQDDINAMKDDYRYLIQQYGDDYGDDSTTNDERDAVNDGNGSTQN